MVLFIHYGILQPEPFNCKDTPVHVAVSPPALAIGSETTVMNKESIFEHQLTSVAVTK